MGSAGGAIEVCGDCGGGGWRFSGWWKLLGSTGLLKKTREGGMIHEREREMTGDLAFVLSNFCVDYLLD